MSNIQARAPTEAVIPKYVQPKTILSLDVPSDLKSFISIVVVRITAGLLFVEMTIGQFLLREFHSEFVLNPVILGKQFIIFDKNDLLENKTTTLFLV